MFVDQFSCNYFRSLPKYYYSWDDIDNAALKLATLIKMLIIKARSVFPQKFSVHVLQFLFSCARALISRCANMLVGLTPQSAICVLYHGIYYSMYGMTIKHKGTVSLKITLTCWKDSKPKSMMGIGRWPLGLSLHLCQHHFLPCGYL